VIIERPIVEILIKFLLVVRSRLKSWARPEAEMLALPRSARFRRIIDMFYLISVNLLRNPRRAILTTLAIAVSIFVLSVLLSLPAIADRILTGC